VTQIRRLPILLLLLAILAPAPAIAQRLLGKSALDRKLVVKDAFFHFGEVYQFAEIEHRFEIANYADRTVHISAVTAALKSGQVLDFPRELGPGQRGEIWVRQAVGNKLGEVAFRFRVESDEPTAPAQKIVLLGFVQSAYDPERLRLDLGEIAQAQGGSRDIELATREAGDLQLLGSEGHPAWISAEALGKNAEGEGLRVRLKVAPGATLGAQTGLILLRTNLPRQPLFEISYTVRVFGDVAPAPTTVDFSWMRPGQSVERRVTLVGRSGRDFAIERIEGASPGLSVEQEACAEGSPRACRTLKLTLAPQTIGNLTGILKVFLAGLAEPLPLPYAGLAVGHNTEVRDITSRLEALAAQESEGEEAPPPAPAEEPPPAVESEREIRLRWKARTEENVYGYLVYRAAQRAGPYQRLGESVVRTVKDGDDKDTDGYQFIDRDVEPGKTYYYYLDAVSRSGIKQRFSGVLSRKIADDASP
jgi:hypothetical protein